jgi:BlaI family penicillinase repressor
MSKPRISEAEWEVMEILWKQAPATAADIIAGLAHTSWAPTTIRTMLARLTDKKIVAAKRQERGIMFRPVVSRKQCVQREGDSFLERVFGGAANPLLMHFVKRAKLTPEEVRELQKILREKGKS